MDEEVLKNVMELFTKVCKNDVNPIKSYKQYLDELTNEDITNIIIFFSTMIKNEKDLEKINNILNESKENKELEILKCLLNHEGQVLSRMQIIDQVWKETDDIPYDRVIDVYIKELRKKLQLDCITTIRNVGYKLERK